MMYYFSFWVLSPESNRSCNTIQKKKTIELSRTTHSQDQEQKQVLMKIHKKKILMCDLYINTQSDMHAYVCEYSRETDFCKSRACPPFNLLILI